MVVELKRHYPQHPSETISPTLTATFGRVSFRCSRDEFKSDKELKEWVWSNCKEEILASMTIVDDDVSVSEAILPSKRLQLLDTITTVQRQFFQFEYARVVFGCLLEGLLDLMESEYGFIGEVMFEDDGTMFLQTHAITNIAWDSATRSATFAIM